MKPVGRNRFSGNLLKKTDKKIEKVKKKRRKGKILSISYDSGFWGAVFGVEAVLKEPNLWNISSWEEGLKLFANVGLEVGLVVGVVSLVRPSTRKKVRKATRKVGRALHQEIESGNQPLIAFLKKYKYVYIDRKGNIGGTNRPRIIIGRMRLKTKDILEGTI